MKKTTLQLYRITEFANELDERWNPKKLWVYYKRGKLPEPYAFVGDRPAWLKEQVDQFINQLNDGPPINSRKNVEKFNNIR